MDATRLIARIVYAWGDKDVVFQTWTALQCLRCTVLGRFPRMSYLIPVFGSPFGGFL